MAHTIKIIAASNRRTAAMATSIIDEINSGKPCIAITMRDIETGEVVGEDEVAVANEYLRGGQQQKTCFYCGRTIGETESYAEGRVLNGTGWKCMCMECSSGPGAKYFDGSYYDQRNTWDGEHPNPEKTKKKREPFTFDLFCEICSGIMVGVGFLITAALLILE